LTRKEELLERIKKHKYIYYELDGQHPEAISDYEYDKLEREFQELGGELWVGCLEKVSLD
jgi:NAD-dependent DNA ligase